MAATNDAKTSEEHVAEKMLEQIQAEVGLLGEDLESLVGKIGESRDVLATFAAQMPAEVERKLLVAIRASREAVKLVLAHLDVHFPEEG